MRVNTQKIRLGVLAGVIGVIAIHAPTHVFASVAPSVSAVSEETETDAQRRERLNARMAEMLRSGDGARLTQPEAQRPARRAQRHSAPARAAPPPARPASTPAPATALAMNVAPPASSGNSWVLGGEAAATSSFAPPPVTSAPVRRSGGAYYTPPRLDLVTAPRVPTDPVECLTQAIYYEARNESEEGQAAVAEVVINRTRSGLYPQSVCEVVYQRNTRTCQFTFTCDGAIGRGAVDMEKWARAERIARDVHSGRSQAILPANSVNYHASYVSPSWGRRLERVRQIGTHIFYGAALGGGVPPGAATTVAAVAGAVEGGLVFVRNEGLDRAYDAFRNAGAQAAAPARPATTGGQP
ncbi:cell wall hydrolase [Brevundimonas staleyi]|uniref:Cell wall hydrolase n=1 Tax=Brevundimonas staleyi TaxID=74326 RepID=A0ABW0FR63_9CAUL